MVDYWNLPADLPSAPPTVRCALPDGPTVQVMNEAEAQTLWTELTEAPFYRTAAAGLGPDEAIVDVGAHVGLAAIRFAAQAPGARVLAFEPAPKTHGCLVANLAEHLPGATAFNMALGSAAGTAELIFHPYIPSSSTLFEDEEDNVRNIEANLDNIDADQQTRQVVWRMFDVRETVQVDVGTLSGIIRDQGIERIGLLKVDVERGELDVLKGLDGEHWPMVRRVLLEVHDIDGRLDEITALMAEHGLRSEISQFGVYTGGTVHLVLATRD
ncbi:FkbM family methyltransferase [Streptomyces virginiae]|uniref:FkbM family methyltransferase n=1 Tax=Streptomyces virginiae TaxID=1961 RepID=UPI002251685D|nr:FkbM family methyltransferase [Streptomyces virginiae]MCX4717890.1 FkbM family methyltransferase [Streptomyces virginiae]